MKKFFFFSFCIMLFSSSLFAERIEPLPFGDMEQWVVRYIEESKLLGGKTKTLYCLAPTDTIRENGPYIFGQNGNPWATSNAYANIIGIEKAAGTMTPELREDGGTCCRLDVDMLGVRVLGMIDIQVLVSGTLFTGRNLEPITTAADPYQNIDFGVPFTGRPSALMFDYKCIVEQERQSLRSASLRMVRLTRQRRISICSIVGRMRRGRSTRFVLVRAMSVSRRPKILG